jgi:hypothetical protein
VLNYEVVNRDTLLSDKVGLLASSLGNIIEEKYLELFYNLCEEISEITFQSKSLIALSKSNLTLLGAAIVNASFIIITKLSGNNILLIRLCSIANLEKDEVREVTHKVLKNTLGKELYQRFEF